VTNKTKTITGASVIAGLLLVFKIWHTATTIGEITTPDNTLPQNIPVTIITTDSSGKKDTMKMEDYLKQNKIVDTTDK
jgi:hypothetical protein